MDIPALAVLVTGILYVSVVVIAKLWIHDTRRVRRIIPLFVVIWAVMMGLGEFFVGWGFNNSCSAYLGCITGFFGYDAFEHFFFGVTFGVILLWVHGRRGGWNLTWDNQWKTIYILLSVVALVSITWEIFEYLHDAFRVEILHQALFNITLQINQLDQPSNADTIGDMCANLTGATVGYGIVRYIRPSLLFGEKTQRGESA